MDTASCFPHCPFLEAGIPQSHVAQDVKSQKPVRPVGKKDKVTIGDIAGMDADTNRGRVELGTDALIFAYILMFLAVRHVDSLTVTKQLREPLSS
eukprot:3635511-Amphidinium_carterae.1